MVRKWVVAGVGAVAVGLLGGAASAGDAGGLPGAHRPAVGAVASVGDARLEQSGPHSCATDTGIQVRYRPGESRDDLVLRLTDQLAYVESVFTNATPGSPAQFRACEESDSLREQLRLIGCGYAPGDSPR